MDIDEIEEVLGGPIDDDVVLGASILVDEALDPKVLFDYVEEN